jgi:NDP-sugar pyrophosphorylase family protein
MKKINQALIMAAGRGIRMKPLTDKIPKAMAPHNGSTLIANGIRKINKVIDNVHITVGYKGAILAKHVIELDVASVFNTEGKGNAWWVFNTLIRYLDEPVYVLTCDNVTDIDFDELAEDYYSKGSPPCMIVPVTPKKGLDGDYIFKTGHIIKELDRKKKSGQYCSGIQILNPVKINKLVDKTDDFYTLWNTLIGKKKLYCSEVRLQKWFTIDNLNQLNRINSQYRIKKKIL